MNVICLGNNWFPTNPGGLDRYVYELTHTLAAAPHNNLSIDLCGIGLPETPTDSPIRLTNLAEADQPLWQRFWSARSNFLKQQFQPDAINLHFALYSFPLLQNLPTDVPITFTFHGPWALESQWEGGNKLGVLVKKWIEQTVYQKCDRFIVLSKAFGTILHEEYQIPWSKIHIIPGGVDTQQFQPSLSRETARQKLNWPQNRFVLFTPRRLVQRMGIDVLLNALSSLNQQFPEVWLAIAGKGPLRETLEHQAIELGLDQQVRFLGYLPDEQLPIAYQAADLTLVPSQALEGFGLVVLESLASGTPVACTPIGGMPEILLPFSPELIANASDQASIATLLEAILSRSIELPSREDCRDYAVRNFDWPKIAQEVKQVLLQPKS